MKYILIFIFLFTGQMVRAQSHFSGWLSNFTNIKLSNKFSIGFDGQVRSTDHWDHAASLLLRAGLNIHVKKNLILMAGYGFVRSRREVGGITGYAPEHRLMEQLLISHPLFHATLSHRFRIEQRFISRSVIENNQLKNEGHVFANRFRYLFRTMIPFGKKLQPKTFFGALQDEVFANFGDKSGVNGEIFDQNRAYGALGYRVSQPLDLEIGYMYQYVKGRNDAFTNNHILQLATYLRL